MAAIADKDKKCRSIERMIAEGRGVTESCRVFGLSEKTFYRWRSERSTAQVTAGRK
ncbi:transposase [Altererythrobacter sp. CC-YST694]|uniref:transposase n=1 Tax=Altererythrobacter sp. CC-YST694 TaxID=2755038 RepID=UPI001D01B753|nr:helix-turn-helix domain-containing protein [Altererythrobacter sp. CC-YST694]MCB5424077.1 transposase [Altererythrobacter sp. CC-YST694]